MMNGKSVEAAILFVKIQKTKTMKLTKKCKEDFEKYLDLLRKHETDRIFSDIDIILHHQGYDFDDWTHSMQYGVYVDFFDSLGIYITTSWDLHINAFNWWVESNRTYSGKEKLRPEARTVAIEKANEIYNLK